MRLVTAGFFVALMFCGPGRAAEPSKADDTPAFFQRDPRAGFEGDGSNYCAPVSISDGLVLLAQHGFGQLLTDVSDEGQMGLVRELAAAMRTDPKIGTDPDQILTGLQRFVESRGYQFQRLEYAGWRPLSAGNQKLKKGTKPALSWLETAAGDAECVEVLNVGWYSPAGESMKRIGGHWVAAVGKGATPGSLLVHNPSLPSEQQYVQTEVELTLLDETFEVTEGETVKNMAGYYDVDGPGLPHGEKYAAVLDGAIVFRLRH